MSSCVFNITYYPNFDISVNRKMCELIKLFLNYTEL